MPRQRYHIAPLQCQLHDCAECGVVTQATCNSPAPRNCDDACRSTPPLYAVVSTPVTYGAISIASSRDAARASRAQSCSWSDGQSSGGWTPRDPSAIKLGVAEPLTGGRSH